MNSARASNHLATVLIAIYCQWHVNLLLGSFDKLVVEFKEMYEIGVKYDLPQFKNSNYNDAFNYYRDGEVAKLPEALKLALEYELGFDIWIAHSFRSTCLAEAYLRLGEFAIARARIREAMDYVEQKQERWFEADVHRVAGEIARAERNESEAEACFERALAVARSQAARSLELRAATSFAGMRRVQGRCDEARGLLAPIYAWFTEGFDKPDLRTARALLDELA